MKVIIAEKPTEYVQCSCCQSRFHQGFLAPKQASGCASTAYIKKEKNEYFIHCHYGSQFDTDRFLITDNTLITQLNTEDTVCDSCIQKYSVIGAIMKDESYDYWTNLSSNVDMVLEQEYGKEGLQQMKALFNTPSTEDDFF